MEIMILDWIQSTFRYEFLDKIMLVITRLGNGGAIWIAACLLLLVIPKTRGTGAAMLSALVLESFFCNVLIKPLAARIRPFDVKEGVQLLIAPPSDYSFPSGHAGAAFASASSLFFQGSRLWLPAGLLALLLGFSRLYLYVHYPSDVAAGILLGVVSGKLGNLLAERLAEKAACRKEKK